MRSIWMASLIGCAIAFGVVACPSSILAQQEDATQEQESDGAQTVDLEADAKEFANANDVKEVEIPVIDRVPFDRLTFDASNDNWVLDVDPLVLEGVSPNAPINPKDQSDRLLFTMETDYPGRRWACPWSSLVKVERYSDLVLGEAEKAMQAKDYATAFRTLLFLSDLSDARGAGKIKQMMDECLYEDGHENLEAGNFGEALTAFEALYERQPRYKVRGAGSLLEKITKCINEFIREKVEAGEYAAARSLLATLRLEYGNKVDEVMQFWELDMKKRALTRLQDVEKAVQAGDGMSAHKNVREVIYVMPSLVESVQKFNEIVERFPFVFVGVTQRAISRDVRRIEDWAARRVGYLIDRWIMEFQKPTDQGGKYIFPGGRLQAIDELGLKFRIQLTQPLPEGVPPILTYELENRLHELATIGSDEYYIPWARLVKTIEIEDERSIVFTLKYPHVLPESLLVMPWFSKGDERLEENFGFYKPQSEKTEEVIYERNDRFPKVAGRQNPLIIERVYNNSAEATDALIRGELDVVDRVYPGDISRLRKDPMITVRPYLIPSVHMLIPNPRNDHMKSDSFRRALHFAINRDLIIKEIISGGSQIEGFKVVSGPFPEGTDVSNDLAYAYNRDVIPREHSALLALVLAQQYVTQETNRLENEGVPNPEVEMPKVVLTFPSTETITAACTNMAQQWRAAGVEAELRPLPPGQLVPENDDWDLLYAEVQMQEPLVDAYRLFGRNGLVKLVDPTIEQALRKLDSSYKWRDISRNLRRVHQQSANNLSILPLWQIVDHYAYRKNVFNIGKDIVSLYQHLDEWRIDGVALPNEGNEVSKKQP